MRFLFLQVLVEKMGVPDTKARGRLRDVQLAVDYSIDRTTVKLGEREQNVYILYTNPVVANILITLISFFFMEHRLL